jgi:hypothetical protein
MGAHNSPFYAAGCADGGRDTSLMDTCPGYAPLGPDPEKSWSVLYRQGYSSTFFPVPHQPCKRCKRQENAA